MPGAFLARCQSVRRPRSVSRTSGCRLATAAAAAEPLLRCATSRDNASQSRVTSALQTHPRRHDTNRCVTTAARLILVSASGITAGEPQFQRTSHSRSSRATVVAAAPQSQRAAAVGPRSGGWTAASMRCHSGFRSGRSNRQTSVSARRLRAAPAADYSAPVVAIVAPRRRTATRSSREPPPAAGARDVSSLSNDKRDPSRRQRCSDKRGP